MHTVTRRLASWAGGMSLLLAPPLYGGSKGAPEALGRPIVVWTEFGLGQACPSGPRSAWSVRHLFYRRLPDGGWIDSMGEWGIFNDSPGGFLRVTERVPIRDMVVLESDTDFPWHFSVPEDGRGPAIGERVFLVQVKETSDGIRYVTQPASVSGYMGPVFSYDRTGNPGSSGSCVIGLDGQFYGINFAGGSTWGLAWLMPTLRPPARE